MVFGSWLVVAGCGVPPDAASTSPGDQLTQRTEALTYPWDQSLYVLGKCFDVPGFNDTNGTNVQIYDCNGGMNQQWEFWYDGTIRPTFNTNKCLDLPGWETDNGTPIQIYDCHGGSNQQWTLAYATSSAQGGLRGFGNKCVDVPGYDTTNGTNLQYYDCNNGGSQKILREPPAVGGSQLVNLKGEENDAPDQELCMGISGGVVGGVVQYGTPVIVWDCNGSPDQTWFRTFQSDPSGQSGAVDLVDGATNYGADPVCLWAQDTTPVDGEYMRSQFCPDLFEGREDFIMNYVKNDAYGFPCFTLQNPETGLYVSVGSPDDGPVTNGMNVYLRTLRASSNFAPTDNQMWCDHSANTGITTLTPDYVVANVIYAPPGSSSSITYQNSTSIGSSVSNTKGFQNSTDVTATVGGNMLLAVDSGSVTFDHTFGDSNTHEVDLTTTWTQMYKKSGEVAGIDHDYDEIWLLIHPILTVRFTPSIANGPDTLNWQFAQGDGGTTDILAIVYAGQLNDHFPMDPGTQDVFNRNGITSDMYQTMLQADAFFQGIAPQPFTNSSRFDYLGEYPIKPLPQGVTSPGVQTESVSQSMTTSDMMTTSYSNSVGFTVSGGTNFGGPTDTEFKAQLTVSNKWTWSHSTSTKDSNGTGSVDTLAITQPLFGYTGPAELHVYEDRIFKTYAFMLDYPAPFSVTDDGGHACSVDGVSMHCCPSGSAMVGVRLDENEFKCAQLADASGQVTADYSTYRYVNGISADGTPTSYYMRACPKGSVMVGYHQDMNILLCQQIPATGFAGGITGEVVDTGTADDYPMHVCESSPYAYAMSGLDPANNLLTCATNPGLH